MTLFEFDKIIKSKYKNYINKSGSLMNFEEFKKIGIKQISKIFNLYFSGISLDYIHNILTNNNIKFIFICLNNKFNLQNIISIIIYHKTISIDKIKYYILSYGIHKEFRKCGYGNYCLDKFTNWIKMSTKSKKQKLLLLKSIESSLKFYLSYGFTQTDLVSNKLFFKYEPIKELKSNQEKILSYLIV